MSEMKGEERKYEKGCPRLDVEYVREQWEL